MGVLFTKIKEHKYLFATVSMSVLVAGQKQNPSSSNFKEEQQFTKRRNVIPHYQTNSVVNNKQTMMYQPYLPLFKKSNYRNQASTSVSSSVNQRNGNHNDYQDWGNHSDQTRFTKSGKIDTLISQIKVSPQFIQYSEVHYIPQSCYLEPDTIVQILQYSVELASDDFYHATLKNREDRRRAKKQNKFQQYEKLILDYNDQIETILESAQAEILYRLGLQKDLFEESLIILMDRGYYQQLYMLQACVPSKKNMNISKIKEVISYNISILQLKPDLFSKILDSLMKNQEKIHLIPMAINVMVQDLIFEKFGIEEEDQIKNLSQIGKPSKSFSLLLIESQTDQEVQKLLSEISECNQELMNSMGFGNLGISEALSDEL